MLEKNLESPLDCKEIQPVHPKGNQSWIFIWRIDAKAEILWPPDAKNQLTGKKPDAGKDWRQEGKGTTGWDDWMASATQLTWVWVDSGCWWWTGRPGVLRFIGSQRVRHDWVTEMNWMNLEPLLVCRNLMTSSSKVRWGNADRWSPRVKSAFPGARKRAMEEK